MSDIARDLGVSVVTVSKVLHNKGNISTATRKRVLKRAKELKYQVNWIARSLVTRRTYTVGLLLPDFSHSFFADVAKAIADTVRPLGYHVIISYFEENPAIEARETEFLVARQVDGLIVASAQSSPKVFNRIVKQGVPLVLIDRPIKGVKASFVGVNNKSIGRIATEHLIRQGCGHLAHLRGPNIALADERVAGFKEALHDHGLTFHSRQIVDAGFRSGDGIRAMKKLLRQYPTTDGVFCYNDPVAIGAMKAISEHGLTIPKDIAVLGAGNVRYSELLSVPLTTVDQGTEQLGRQAAEILMEQIDSGRVRCETVLREPTLIVRDSSVSRVSTLERSIVAKV